MSELGSEPDFFEDLDAVAPEGICAFADAFFDIGRDRCFFDEFAVDEIGEAGQPSTETAILESESSMQRPPVICDAEDMTTR